MKKNTQSPMYKIRQGTGFLKDVQKILKRGDKELLPAIQEIIDELKVNPHQKRPKVDIKLISSKKEAIYRVRIGKYRMIYEIDEPHKIIYLTMFFPRGEGYH